MTSTSEIEQAETLARVSIVADSRQVDVTLPTTVPSVALVPTLVALTIRDGPADEVPAAGRWTLTALGGQPVPPEQTLADAGITDGDLLLLRRADEAVPPPLFDDVIDAVARIGEASADAHGPSPRTLGSAAAVLAATATAALLVSGRGGSTAAVIAAGSVIALLAVATIGARRFTSGESAGAAAGAAVPMAAAAGALVPPGTLGAPHLLAASAAALVAAAAGRRACGVTSGAGVWLLAVVTAAVFTGCGALAGTLVHLDPAVAGVAVAVLGVAGVTAAPRAAVLLARLPLPPIPVVGGPVDPTGGSEPAIVEGVGAVGAQALPVMAGLADRADRASGLLSGLAIGSGVAAAGGALLAASPWLDTDWRRPALALAVSAVLALRGRVYADRRTTATLAGVGLALALIEIVLAGALGTLPPTVAALIAAAIGVVGYGCGVLAPAATFSPVARKAAEIGECVLIGLLVPLGAWLLDLYALVRNLP